MSRIGLKCIHSLNMDAIMTKSNVAVDVQKARKLSEAGLKAFFNICDAWSLNTEQMQILLGKPPRSTYFAWRKDPSTVQLSRDTLERISYILGIYKALQILLPNPKAADEWINRPNTEVLFGGKPAIDRMLSGNVSDLFVVRQYLDAMRGGWS